MAGTQVASGDALAVKLYSAAVFANTQRKNTFTNRMTGPSPSQSDAESKIRNQTSPDYPIVRVTDLSDTAGDQLTVDLFHTIGGKPIVGDRQAEGRGERLTTSTQEVKIDLLTKVVDAGGKMTAKRTKHNLRRIALAQLVNYFAKLNDQQTLVHLAGNRGFDSGPDWVVPLATDADFADIMINAVKAPTYNRHFVADGTALVRGGAQLASIDSTDLLALEHIDALSVMLSEDQFKLQPIKIEDDPAAEDEPMYLLMVSHRAWHGVATKTSGQNWRTFLQNAWNRASYGSKHPLFKGEAGMWGNILVRKMERNVRFNPGSVIKHVTVGNRLTATETDVTVNGSLTAGYNVDRCLLLGGQAMAHVYGKNGDSGTFANWKERRYNFERAMEVAGDMMTGKSKLRFSYQDSNGNLEPTDHGVLVLDVAVPPVAS